MQSKKSFRCHLLETHDNRYHLNKSKIPLHKSNIIYTCAVPILQSQIDQDESKNKESSDINQPTTFKVSNTADIVEIKSELAYKSSKYDKCREGGHEGADQCRQTPKPCSWRLSLLTLALHTYHFINSFYLLKGPYRILLIMLGNAN